MTMFTVIIVLICVVTSTLVASGNPTAGLRVTVSENALKEINDAEIRALKQDLNGKRFGDVRGSSGKLDYSLTNIRITHLGTITAEVDLQGSSNSITWNSYLSSISVKADWRVKYKVGGWISFDVSDSGSAELDVGRTSVGISVIPSVSNGNIQISLRNCDTNIGHLDVDFRGGLLAWILNILKNVFKRDMESELENAICDAVRKSLNEVSEDMKNIDTLYSKIAATFETSILDVKTTIDNSFTQITVTDNSIVSYHKGTFTWNGHTLASSTGVEPFPPASRLDLSFDIRTGVVNEFLRATAAAGVLDGNMTYLTEKEESRRYLLLFCEDSKDICIGNIIKEASKLYPNRYIGLYWNVTDASLQSGDGDLTGTIIGRLNVNADNASSSDNLFSSYFNVTVPAQVKLAGPNISARINGIKGSLTIDQSIVGPVLTPETKALINLLTRSMKSTILNHINANPTRYDVKLPKEVSIQNSKISLYKGFIRVAVDVCYKRRCSLQGSDEWVGNSSLADKLSVELEDIVPTTSTTTTSTSTTTRKGGKAGSHISSAEQLKSSAILTTVIMVLCYGSDPGYQIL